MAAPQLQNKQLTVIDLTATDAGAQESERPPKRLKLDSSTGMALTGVDGKTVFKVGETRSASGPATLRAPPLAGRVRPAWSFQELLSEMYGPGTYGGSQEVGIQALKSSASPPAFPVRPWKHAPERHCNSATESRESSPEREVQTTPYHLEAPPVAPVLKGDKVADFSPWSGNHPEDVLNEQTAKQGHYDRTQVSQNESNTARPSLYAQLRHRSGLQVLSSVLVAALDKRQTCNKVTATSTFKPPPRVTLTDNKREAWLRDLANPSVPLRRLSRTIPHGIRGKVLLDQCLSKWIPIGRAVWLAKCVGANEIRAFKRKGTSGTLALGLETKWVRDWTTNVQQFIEGVIGSCGKADWKLKMAYAARLTARLFFDNLLDQDQHLEWFLSSVEWASLDSLPIWLLMLDIYWDSLVRYRKRGRRLAELLLEKLRQGSAKTIGPKEPLQPIINRLSHFVKKLIHEQTSSAVLPMSWDKYKDILFSCLNPSDCIDGAIFQSLADRNARVQRAKSCRKVAQSSPQRQVIRLLDSARSMCDMNAISEECLNTVENKAALVSKLLEWTATPFRQGLVRVYVAVRLLRKWKRSGIDIDSHILSFLTETREKTGLDMDNVYHVISELVRSQTFSVGKYLQWLMARGVIGCHQHEGQSVMSDVEVLSQLPGGRLSEHVQNLRKTLLTRAGLSASEEDYLIKAIKKTVRQRLPGIFRTEFDDDTVVLDDVTQLKLNWAVKSEIGQWIRRGISEHYKNATKDNVENFPSRNEEVSSLTPDEFFIVRDLLENFGDLSMLADVLNHASNSDNIMVLISAVDTLNYHFDSFNVIGATTGLFRNFAEACTRVNNAGTLAQDLIFSLINLGLRLSNEVNTVAILRQQLSQLERKSTLAASSPILERMAENFDHVNMLFNEDLDRFLTSGNNIDEPTLVKVFETLSKQLESGDGEGRLSANDTCRYLAQLRSFNPKQFDLLLVNWIGSMLKSSTRPKVSKIVAPLIGVGCVTLQAFFSLTKKLLHSEPGPSTIPNIIGLHLDLLELLVPMTPGRHGSLDLVSYRFQIAQQEFLSKHSEEALRIIHDTAACLSTQASPAEMDTARASLESRIIPLLRDLLVRNPESVAAACMQKFTGSYSAPMDAVQKALDLLLGLRVQPEGQISSVSEVEKVINMANDFSLPFCQLKLQILFNADSGEEIRNGIIDVMFKAAVTDVRARRSRWVDLVALMSKDAVRQIRQRAEKGLFSVALSESPIDGDSLVITDGFSAQDTAKVYLTIIEELAFCIPESGVPSIPPLLVEKINLLLQKFIIAQANFKNFSENRGSMMTDQLIQSFLIFERNFAFWFSTLLRMIIIHRPAFNTPSMASKPNTLLEQSRLLIAICCIALSRPLSSLVPQSQPNYHSQQWPFQWPTQRSGAFLQTYALDVAASLVDTLSEEARQQCVRFLKDRCPPFLHVQNDPRLLYLFGPVTDVAHCNTSQPTPASSPSANFPLGSSATQSSAPPPLGTLMGHPEDPGCLVNRLRIYSRGRAIGSYPLRAWEMLEGAAPIMGVNDTAVGLGYFGARRVRG